MSPQGGLWPGSEPNVNILAEAGPLNRIGMVWGVSDLGVRERGEEELEEGRDLGIEFRDRAVGWGWGGPLLAVSKVASGQVLTEDWPLGVGARVLGWLASGAW